MALIHAPCFPHLYLLIRSHCKSSFPIHFDIIQHSSDPFPTSNQSGLEYSVDEYLSIDSLMRNKLRCSIGRVSCVYLATQRVIAFSHKGSIAQE